MNREQVISACVQAADRSQLPRRLFVACGIAESNLAYNAERYGTETGYAKNLIKAIGLYGIDEVGDWDGTGRSMTGRQAWDALMARTWPDVSHGCLQITVQHSSFFGDGSPSFENVMAFRQAAFSPHLTLEWAIPRFKAYYKPWEDDAVWKALNRWNYPAGNGQPWHGNGENYRRALREADAMLAAYQPISGPQGDDVSPEAIEAIRAVLDGMYARASAHRVNGNHAEADALFNEVDRIIAAWPPLGRG